jgi:hypothetical protein
LTCQHEIPIKSRPLPFAKVGIEVAPLPDGDSDLARLPNGHSARVSFCRFAQKSLLFVVITAQSSKAEYRFSLNADLDAKAGTKCSVPRKEWPGARGIWRFVFENGNNSPLVSPNVNPMEITSAIDLEL